MERWEIKHRTFVVERYVATKPVTQTQRDFRKQFGFKEAPFRNTILHYFESFKIMELSQIKNILGVLGLSALMRTLQC